MPTQEDIDQQQKLLDAHRARLAHYLFQRASLGRAHEPPGVDSGIKEARADIRSAKVVLRGLGLAVVDHPNDEEALLERLAPSGWRRYIGWAAILVGASAIGVLLLRSLGFSLGNSVIAPATSPPASLSVVASVTKIPATVASDLPAAISSPTVPTTISQMTAAPIAAAAPCLTNISIGEPMLCALSATGVDSYTLEADKGDRLLVVVARAKEINNAGMEPSFTISPQGSLEVFGCTASHNTHAEKFCTIPSTGTYEMTVQSQPSAGNIYRIFVQRLNNPAHTLPITGVFFTSEITRNAQFDSYTIEIANAADVFIKIDPNRSKLEPWFIVYGLNGDPLPDCEAESPSIAERECYLPSAGRYTMLVAPRLGRDSIGSYTGSITTKSR